MGRHIGEPRHMLGNILPGTYTHSLATNYATSGVGLLPGALQRQKICRQTYIDREINWNGITKNNGCLAAPDNWKKLLEQTKNSCTKYKVAENGAELHIDQVVLSTGPSSQMEPNVGPKRAPEMLPCHIALRDRQTDSWRDSKCKSNRTVV